MNYTPLINRTEDYIESHLKEKITMEDLARHCGMSVFHFHRVFKATAHETLQHYCSRIKIERSAIVMAVNPSLSITSIAYLYGFSDSSAYIRAFKRHLKCTPTQFRNRKIRQSFPE